MDSTRAIILPPGTFMYIVCANKHIYLFNNAVYFCAHASQVPWVEGRSPRPHEVLSSWAYQSQRRGRSLAAGAKRWMLLFLPPHPLSTPDPSSPDFVIPHPCTQGKKSSVCVCVSMFFSQPSLQTHKGRHQLDVNIHLHGQDNWPATHTHCKERMDTLNEHTGRSKIPRRSVTISFTT